MKVVIFCGGKGTRLSEETKKIPKPMVKIGKIPILIHIMNFYSKNGFNEFILTLGYKKNFIKMYFKKNKFPKWNIDLVDTGDKTLTGHRLLKIKNKLLDNDNFLLTYGDGLCDVKLKNLIKFHKKQKKIVTVTAVRPPARFGELIIKGTSVIKFDEKNYINTGRINGGFFVCNKKLFNFIPKKNCMFEREPMSMLTKKKELAAYMHNGFWQCMDTIRDKDLLNKIWKNGKAKWK